MAPLSPINQSLLDFAAGRRLLTDAQLHEVLEHVAEAGFDPDGTERARGRLAGLEWQRRILAGSDRLPPADVHYLRHVIARREWPVGTDQRQYIASIQRVIREPTSGVFLSRFQSVWSLGIIRRSHELRGPAGSGWVLVQYRIGRGHWMTAFQPALGLQELDAPDWSDLRWLRRRTLESGR